MVETRAVTTAEELLRLPDSSERYELVRGELRKMNPAGARHGRIAMKLGARLDRYTTVKNLGIVLAAETGFRLSRSPDTVRAPDISFVARERIPLGGPPDGYWDLSPDLAVEVVSPNDTAAEVQSKVQMWLEAGTRLAWVVYPGTRSVVAHNSLKDISTLTANDILTGGGVVPGFQIPVTEVFE